MPDLATLPTPCLLLDEPRMAANVARIHGRLAGTGVAYRAHLKTAKSVEVARRQMTGPHGPAMVSTLKEAGIFAAAGVTDLTYGVGIAPDKLDRVRALRATGVDLAVILDSVAQAEAVAAASTPELPLAALEAAAEGERLAVVGAAGILRAAGHACPVVSAGSTPTLMSARRFDGLTEFRAGVCVFFDLFQAGVGVCAPDEIALSVLTEVIGHQEDKGWTITDAGWMAMSRDRGTAGQALDQGYGLICNLAGRPIPDLIVVGANQEHGIVAQRPGSPFPPPKLPLGTRLRILPNHACATGAQYDAYEVVGPDGWRATWPRFSGW